MIIYKITNKVNNKCYIGQTRRSLRVRWTEHCGKKENCKRLSGAISKYGKDSFLIEQIDSAESIDELNKKEVYWIVFYKSSDRKFGYNIEIGGDGKFTGDSTLEKLKNRKHPSEFYDWSFIMKNKKPAWSTINYKGKKSKEHCLNISKNAHLRRSVNQFDLEGNFIAFFETIKKASIATNVGRNSISACCVGRTKIGKGFIWKYAD
jgi:group I intron endonuclease